MSEPIDRNREFSEQEAIRRAKLQQLVDRGESPYLQTRFDQTHYSQDIKEAIALYSELGGTNPAWKKVYEDYSAFRRDANLWFRFTEAGFDDFMQGQKL